MSRNHEDLCLWRLINNRNKKEPFFILPGTVFARCTDFKVVEYLHRNPSIMQIVFCSLNPKSIEETKYYTAKQFVDSGP